MGNNQGQAHKHPEFEEMQPLLAEAQLKVVDKHGQAYNTSSWQATSLRLHSKVLSLTSPSFNIPIPINDRFEVLKESSNQQCLVVSGFVQLQHFYCMLKFDSLHEYLVWGQKLKEAKRPTWQGVDTLLCAICSLKFNFIRRQHHCRSCGKAVCNNCSPALAILTHLGYENFQRICLRCGPQLQHMTVPRLGKRRRSVPGIRVNKSQLERSILESRSTSRDRRSLQPI